MKKLTIRNMIPKVQLKKERFRERRALDEEETGQDTVKAH